MCCGRVSFPGRKRGVQENATATSELNLREQEQQQQRRCDDGTEREGWPKVVSLLLLLLLLLQRTGAAASFSKPFAIGKNRDTRTTL